MNRIIIDVREPLEFKMGHVESAINIPPSELMAGAEELQNIPNDTELILYCRTGSRSNVAIYILKDLGYSNLVNGINKLHVEAKYL